MRNLRGWRRWPYLMSKARQNSTRRFLSPFLRNQEEETSTRSVALTISGGSRRLATQSKPAEPIQLRNADGLAEQAIGHQSLPYLEAYNLMEENADVIFDDEKMLKERSFSVDDAATLDRSSPLPVAELPGPKSWPLVGSLPYMLSHKDFDPKRVYLFWRAVREEFGPIFRKDMPGHPNMIFITDPSDVQKLFQSTMYNPIRPGMQSLKKIRGPGGADGKTNTYQDVFKGKAGFTPIRNPRQNEEWWRVRRQVQKPVTNSEIVGRYLPRMNDVADTFIQRIRSIRDGNNEVPGTFKREVYKWALESLGTIALERRLGLLDPNQEEESSGSRLTYLVEQLLEALHETENVKIWQYFPTSSIKKLQEAHDIFTEVALEAIQGTQEIIKARLALSEQELDERNGNVSSLSQNSSGCPYQSGSSKGESTDSRTLLETMLESPGLAKEDVLTFLLDMLATGIDTTSHTVCHMLYLLSRNPGEQKRLREEIQSIVPDPRRLTPQQLGSLTYAKAVFRETLRVMPVNVGITRKLTHDTVLSGYLIPKGWQVVVPTMLVNLQERVFPRASEFLPERFLRGSSLAPRHHFGFLPFSFGPRMCIGRRIAYQEVICLVVRILSEFEVDYKYEDIQLVNRLAYGPLQPLKFTFTDIRRSL